MKKIERLQINNGIVFSPFYVFIKGVNKLTDIEILDFFRIQNAEIVKNGDVKNKTTSLFITEDSNWIHIMDFWDYCLYHNENENKRIIKLAEKFDIYTCSVGDSDHSFDFKYFKNGQLFREYIVEDPEYKGGQLTKDYGTKLMNEENALLLEDELDKVLEIANGIGIRFAHTKEKIRHYQYVNELI